MNNDMNRKWNSKNEFQGKYKRVLCVCSAGLLRSPTAAWVLSNEPYNFNTRAVGLEQSYALIPVDDVLIEWADEIVCMNEKQEQALKGYGKPVRNLNINDSFDYRDKGLVTIIKMRAKEIWGNSNEK